MNLLFSIIVSVFVVGGMIGVMFVWSSDFTMTYYLGSLWHIIEWGPSESAILYHSFSLCCWWHDWSSFRLKSYRSFSTLGYFTKLTSLYISKIKDSILNRPINIFDILLNCIYTNACGSMLIKLLIVIHKIWTKCIPFTRSNCITYSTEFKLKI